ncbi:MULTISPECIES: SDR family oxidoreductase [Moorena]|uniref:SDR family NAD(P)-dependent oxidoreductase n=2 Tax=Moorena producens TaxID=1155739 RepID=A0A1D9FWU7_MOOP1|nr:MULTISPECIES: SDR family oxidoreductase [Moorena]NEP49970.1 SDR family oxidoreductase [Moorena sp. SIO3C2]AOY79849.1 SDR family NAD(P)-dependent oxidoreductase [Moorena producens JHB]EGJ35069.1 dehydrogenase [Moorena producens 3L]NEP33871.1 SDR family oxidoreductase [Moorena sp. SIO3B2]NEP64528.1 SDR family oxidoreductase [Moorena sp. SIO3A5]
MATQTVIITGGATGIGYAIAEGFLNTGANVMINGRTLSKLESAAQKLNQPDRIQIIAGDITDPTFAPKMVTETVAKFGRVDVLINNAGIFAVKNFTDYTIDELSRYLGYVRGTFALTQETVKQMRKQGDGGAVVNISTILAFNGIKALPSSAPIMAKAAITAMVKNLSVELAADKIRINAVAPGIVLTPLLGEVNQETVDDLNQQQPLGRVGTPKDIADAVLYLANANWVTGVILPVDGGVDAGGDGTSNLKQ